MKLRQVSIYTYSDLILNELTMFGSYTVPTLASDLSQNDTHN
jgi:hypothetical protein